MTTEATDTTYDINSAAEADLLLDILSENPSMGILLANTALALHYGLAVASEVLSKDPDNVVAAGVMKCASGTRPRHIHAVRGQSRDRHAGDLRRL